MKKVKKEDNKTNAIMVANVLKVFSSGKASLVDISKIMQLTNNWSISCTFEYLKVSESMKLVELLVNEEGTVTVYLEDY